MTRLFAQNTKIAVSQTINEVGAIIARYGGDLFQHMVDNLRNLGIFQFEYAGFLISYNFPLGSDQQERQRIYRAAAQCVKFRLEEVASGIRSPAVVFFAHIIANPSAPPGEQETMFDKAKTLLPAPVIRKP